MRRPPCGLDYLEYDVQQGANPRQRGLTPDHSTTRSAIGDSELRRTFVSCLDDRISEVTLHQTRIPTFSGGVARQSRIFSIFPSSCKLALQGCLLAQPVTDHFFPRARRYHLELGVTALQLNPMTESCSVGNVHLTQPRSPAFRIRGHLRLMPRRLSLIGSILSDVDFETCGPCLCVPRVSICQDAT